MNLDRPQAFLGRRNRQENMQNDPDQALVNDFISVDVLRSAGIPNGNLSKWLRVFQDFYVGTSMIEASTHRTFDSILRGILLWGMDDQDDNSLWANNQETDRYYDLRDAVDIRDFFTMLSRSEGFDINKLSRNLDEFRKNLALSAGPTKYRFGGVSDTGRMIVDRSPGAYGLTVKGSYVDVQPPGYGPVPVDNRIPVNDGIRLVRDMYRDLPKTIAVTKPEAQFNDLLNRITNEVDNGLYKYKEDLLDYKSNHIYNALNALKREYNERKLRIGGDTVVFEPDTTNYTLQSTLNQPLFPVVVKLRVVGQPVALANTSSGIYLGNAVTLADSTQSIKLANYGSSRRKEYNFALAPYFGYVDSMYQILKSPKGVPDEDLVRAPIRHLPASVPFVGGLVTGSHHRLTVNIGKKSAVDVEAVGDPLAGFVQAMTAMQQALLNWRQTAQRIVVEVTQPAIARGGGRMEQEALVRDVPYVIAPENIADGAWGFIVTHTAQNGDRIANVPDFVKTPFFITTQFNPNSFPANRNSYFRLTLNADGQIGAAPSTPAEFAQIVDSYPPNGVDADPRENVEFSTRVVGLMLSHVQNIVANHINRVYAEYNRLRDSYNEIARFQQYQWEIPPYEDIRRNDFEHEIVLVSGISGSAQLIAQSITNNIQTIRNRFLENMPNAQYWSLLVRDFDRPLRVPSNIHPEQTDVITSKTSLLNYLRARLDTQVRSIGADLIRGSQVNGGGPQRRTAGVLVAGQVPWQCSGIHMPVAAGDTLRVKLWVEGFDTFNSFIGYVQLMSWIRNFTYSRQQEKQKIARTRVSKFVNADSRNLRKVVTTFGGTPDAIISKR